MQDTAKQLESLLNKVQDAEAKLQIASDEAKLAGLEARINAPDFWSSEANAADISKQAASLRKHIESWRELEAQVQEALELAQLGDNSLAEELAATYSRLESDYGEREFALKLSGPYDKHTALLSIYAGTGGTDAQDWASMLLRMYLRYAEAAGWTADIIDQSPGEEAGLKSVSVEISGPFAYGKLKSEKGVHRLVRLSPFNSDNLRQTSFALVDVLPEIETTEDFEINPDDLRIDVYRAGGHGGQSVNTTDSAVRITHIPTGLVVAIQNERSQLQNKAKAMTVLKSRLAALMHEQHLEKLDEIRGATAAPEWGNQIRSYVLHPYTKVKDHRTGHETSQAAEVLDGDLEDFIQAYLSGQVGKVENASA